MDMMDAGCWDQPKTMEVAWSNCKNPHLARSGSRSSGGCGFESVYIENTIHCWNFGLEHQGVVEFRGRECPDLLYSLSIAFLWHKSGFLDNPYTVENNFMVIEASWAVVTFFKPHICQNNLCVSLCILINRFLDQWVTGPILSMCTV